MKRVLLAVVLIGAIGGAVWYVTDLRSQPEAVVEEDSRERNDFEAERVLLQQFDAEGRMQYEIEAERIVQLRDGGGIVASRMTLRHDPPGSAPGSAQRWVVTADEATLPPDSRIVTLKGAVQARSVPVGTTLPLELRTDALLYDMDAQQVHAEGEFALTHGGTVLNGSGLRVDISGQQATIESGTNGKISL